MNERREPRLFVAPDLVAGATIALEAEQAHYLRQVMRRSPGDGVRLFNGRDGEWRGRLLELGRREAILALEERLRPQVPVRPLSLLFAPVKRAGTELIVQKATELGASRLQPVITRRTERAGLRPERLALIAREAAEQCERLDVPALEEAESLEAALADWPAARSLLFCDERAGAPALLDVVAGLAPPAGLLIGPEGGFDPAEHEMLHARPGVLAVSLGPRILRAETAALAALAVCQAAWDSREAG